MVNKELAAPLARHMVKNEDWVSALGNVTMSNTVGANYMSASSVGR